MQAPGQDYRARRLGLGLTLRQMSRVTGFSAAYLSDLELGKREGPVETWAKLEAALRGEEWFLLATELLNSCVLTPERVIELARKGGAL